MGKPDQLGKDIFSEETETLTQGAFAFEIPAELPVFEVRLDGLLSVRDPARIAQLPAPWSLAPTGAPVLLDLKMQRDHLDLGTLELLLHRRQAWQAAQLRRDGSYSLQPALWMIAGSIPDWSSSPQSPWSWKAVAPGCYALEPSWFSLLWIASNELPLHEALVPFLVTRRGRSRVEFCAWALAHRPVAWTLRMLQYLPMTQAQRDELLRYFPPTDDPEVLENREQLARGLVKVFPKLRDEMIDEGKLQEARKAVARVLHKRGLSLSVEHQARLSSCHELPTLERWLDQAVTAASSDDALR